MAILLQSMGSRQGVVPFSKRGANLKLSTGAIAGIAVAGVVALLCILGLILCWRRRTQRQALTQQCVPIETAPALPVYPQHAQQQYVDPWVPTCSPYPPLVVVSNCCSRVSSSSVASHAQQHKYVDPWDVEYRPNPYFYPSIKDPSADQLRTYNATPLTNRPTDRHNVHDAASWIQTVPDMGPQSRKELSKPALLTPPEVETGLGFIQSSPSFLNHDSNLLETESER